MSVTISSSVYWADWPYASDATFEVRAKSNRSWVSAESQIVAAGESRVVGTGTITALRPTLPAITLPSTSAGLDDQTSKWTVTLHRVGKSQPVTTVLADFPLPVSFEPSVTWAQIKIHKNGKQPLRDTSVYTKTETDYQISLAAGALNKANASPAYGRTALSVAPVSAADPIAVGDNDRRVIDASIYASFAAAIAAIGATPTTLNISTAITAVATATVPSTLTLRFLQGGSLSITTGQTLTIQGPIIAGLVKIFNNATAGQGTISFTGNTKLSEDHPEWWGAVGDGVTNDAPAVQAAINAWPSATGGTVIFSAPYGLGASGINVTNKSFLVLKSNGAQKAGFKQLVDSTQAGALILADLFLSGCTSCRVEGLCADGNSLLGDPISLYNCTDCVIEGNDCFGGSSAAAGAMISGGLGLRNRYVNNKCHDSVGASRGMWIGNTNNDGETSSIISGNMVWNTGSAIIGVYIYCTISNNIVGPNNGGGSGISVAATSGANNVSKGTTITGNTIISAGFAGIQSDASYPNYTEFITVTGNYIYDSGNGGIYVVNARDWVVSGNVLQDNQAIGGIFMQNTFRATLTGNHISNTAAGAARPSGAGISISPNTSIVGLAMSDILIAGNTIRNMKQAGIDLRSGATAILSNVTISGNIVDGCDAYGIFQDGAAATFYGVNITGNTIIGCSIDGASSGLVVAQIKEIPLADGIANISDNVVTAGAHQGTVALVGGTATVSTTAAKYKNIILTRVIAGGTIGILTVGTITADTSFVINSVDSAGALVADTSTVFWKILN